MVVSVTREGTLIYVSASSRTRERTGIVKGVADVEIEPQIAAANHIKCATHFVVDDSRDVAGQAKPQIGAGIVRRAEVAETAVNTLVAAAGDGKRRAGIDHGRAVAGHRAARPR